MTFFNKTGRLIILALSFAALALVMLGACSSSQALPIEGIVQEVNEDTSSLTIKTGDDKTVDISLNSSTEVRVNGGSLESIIFEPGLAAKVYVDGKVATLLEVKLAQLYGAIIDIGQDRITLQPSGSSQKLELLIKPYSLIQGQGGIIPLNLLKRGGIVEAHFNPVSKTAFRITEMPEGFSTGDENLGSRTEGVIADFKDGKLTIKTTGGVPTVIQIVDSTDIRLPDGSRGSPQDLKIGSSVKAYFSEVAKIAYEVQLE